MLLLLPILSISSLFNMKILLLLLVLSAATAAATCTFENNNNGGGSNTALKYKLAAIATILVAGVAGVTLPLLSRRVPALGPGDEGDVFFLIKAFAAGVILATGFVHILPDAFDRLASPCLAAPSWGDFPLAGLVAMAAAIGTLMIDAFATSFYRKKHFGGGAGQVTHATIADEEERTQEHARHVHAHTHATHGHAHGSSEPIGPVMVELPELIRNRIISQVLR